jgi:hypothetical protein
MSRFHFRQKDERQAMMSSTKGFLPPSTIKPSITANIPPLDNTVNYYNYNYYCSHHHHESLVHVLVCFHVENMLHSRYMGLRHRRTNNTATKTKDDIIDHIMVPPTIHSVDTVNDYVKKK